MASERVDAYLDARRAQAAATDRVQKMVRTIQAAANKLLAWDGVAITNSGVVFPKDVIQKNRIIDGQEWPTAEQLAKALAAWHDAGRKAETAWEMVSAADRVGLQPPA